MAPLRVMVYVQNGPLKVVGANGEYIDSFMLGANEGARLFDSTWTECGFSGANISQGSLSVIRR